MTTAAYEQLLVLLRHCVVDNPPDDQVRRLSKGLVKALTRFLSMQGTDSTDQARIGTPRPSGPRIRERLPGYSQETDSGEISR